MQMLIQNAQARLRTGTGAQHPLLPLAFLISAEFLFRRSGAASQGAAVSSCGAHCQVRKAFGSGRVASLSLPIPKRALSLRSIPQACAVVLRTYCSVKEMGSFAEKPISLQSPALVFKGHGELDILMSHDVYQVMC